MIDETLLQFEDKVKLLISHVSVLKKDYQVLMNKGGEKTESDVLTNQSEIKVMLRKMIGSVDSELKKIKDLTP